MLNAVRRSERDFNLPTSPSMSALAESYIIIPPDPMSPVPPKEISSSGGELQFGYDRLHRYLSQNTMDMRFGLNKVTLQWTIVLLLSSAISAAMYYAVEHGDDRLIGIVFAGMMPILFLILFRDNVKKYRSATDSQRKLAKLKSDLPLLVTGFSLAFTVVTQGFASEWNSGLKVIDRMEPELRTLSALVNAKQCIPRVNAKKCTDAKDSLKEVYQQITHPDAEMMRKTLTKLRLNAIVMTFDEPQEVGNRHREIIDTSISAMESRLPPEMRWQQVFNLPVAIATVVIFLISSSMRFALSWVEWQIARSREGYPA